MSKGNFLLSDEWKAMFVNLPDAEAGQLIKAAFCYHTGEEVSIDNPITEAIFQMIKEKIDENEKKYAETCQKRAEAARAKANKSMQMHANANKSEQMTPDNDSDSDNDTYINVSNIPPIIPPQKKQTKHKFGEYKHVLLSDDDHQKLCSEFGESLVQDAIRKVDEYCETSGKTYKNYNLVIRRWGIDRAKEDARGKANRVAQALQDSYNMMREWAEGG